ncbi:hypothetical protein LHFGNBLO_000051 [Mesorhizobium sp. AR10]|uniref:hypothetical protein n=1 Tax=Mesorhizobium sp. AR10 TaxID=2865839 RepID=UPI00215EFA65|nr:hypothetical protein [Mesorhizobium sp. AR10]UVK38767.1 hypothetical protein LHFGNBLO_000051 [Mesorhizobium sp. AR10]
MINRKSTNVRDITDSIKLHDWIVEQAVKSAVTDYEFIVIHEFLDQVITEIVASSYLPARAVPANDIDNILDLLLDSDASDWLVEFVRDTLIAIIFLDKGLMLHQVVERLAKAAGLQSDITFTGAGNEVRIKSSSDLIETHGVLIDVVVPHQLRVRSVLRPRPPRYRWEFLPAVTKPKKTARTPRRPANPEHRS